MSPFPGFCDLMGMLTGVHAGYGQGSLSPTGRFDYALPPALNQAREFQFSGVQAPGRQSSVGDTVEL